MSTSTSTTQAPEVLTNYQRFNLDGLLWAFVVHGNDVSLLPQITTKITIAQLKTYYLQVLAVTENRECTTVPDSPEKVQLYVCRGGVVDAEPASNDKTWMDLAIPWLTCDPAPLWPEEILVASFQQPDGTWEPVATPNFKRVLPINEQN